MNQKPRILIVNDDGIYASGLRTLWEVLREVAEVTVVAPASERSGAAMSVSYFRPLHLRRHKWDGADAYSLSGTPADCVRIALRELLTEPPDLVFSGINCGSNAGRNLFYSGTVGGVMEAALNSLPGVAMSLVIEDEQEEPDYAHAAAYAPLLLGAYLEGRLPAKTILNVNFPKGAAKGLRMARQGKGYWREAPERRVHPQGQPYYWLGGQHAEFEEAEDSDILLLQQGYATAVPLKAHEMTHEELLVSHADIFNGLASPTHKGG